MDKLPFDDTVVVKQDNIVPQGQAAGVSPAPDELQFYQQPQRGQIPQSLPAYNGSMNANNIPTQQTQNPGFNQGQSSQFYQNPNPAQNPNAMPNTNFSGVPNQNASYMGGIPGSLPPKPDMSQNPGFNTGYGVQGNQYPPQGQYPQSYWNQPYTANMGQGPPQMPYPPPSMPYAVPGYNPYPAYPPPTPTSGNMMTISRTDYMNNQEQLEEQKEEIEKQKKEIKALHKENQKLLEEIDDLKYANEKALKDQKKKLEREFEEKKQIYSQEKEEMKVLIEELQRNIENATKNIQRKKSESEAGRYENTINLDMDNFNINDDIPYDDYSRTYNTPLPVIPDDTHRYGAGGRTGVTTPIQQYNAPYRQCPFNCGFEAPSDQLQFHIFEFHPDGVMIPDVPTAEPRASGNHGIHDSRGSTGGREYHDMEPETEAMVAVRVTGSDNNVKQFKISKNANCKDFNARLSDVMGKKRNKLRILVSGKTMEEGKDREEWIKLLPEHMKNLDPIHLMCIFKA